MIKLLFLKEHPSYGNLLPGRFRCLLLHFPRKACRLPYSLYCRTADKELVRRCVEENDESCFAAVSEAVCSCGALEYTRSKAGQAVAQATQALAVFSGEGSGQYGKSLLELASFSVERSF